MNSINHNIVFGGTKFKFLNNVCEFNSLVDKNVPKLEVSNGIWGDYKVTTKAEDIFTAGIGSCTTYTLKQNNMLDTIMGHYNKGAQEVTRFIEYFKDKGRAFILGGSFHHLDKFFKADFQDFKKAGIPTTTFWGQNGSCSDIYYQTADETLDIYNSSRNKITTPEDIKREFNIINITKGDQVFIGNKEIDPKFLNQNNSDFKL